MGPLSSTYASTRGGAAGLLVRDWSVDYRVKGADDDVPIPITAQKLEGLVRLAEASARLRLADTITKDDRSELRILFSLVSRISDLTQKPETLTPRK